MILLAIGDVVGAGGVQILEERLAAFRKTVGADCVVANGENASMRGATAQDLVRIHEAGADVVTLGNHTWGQWRLAQSLDELSFVVRPMNFSPKVPGQGYTVFETRRGARVGVVNLIGRAGLDYNAASPFLAADRALRELQGEADFTVIDFHAEMTSEKRAFGFYLDGRAAAVFGTHTHVATADAQVLPQGTGYISDLGMTGSVQSVLGILPEQSINGFLGGVPQRYKEGPPPYRISGALFDLDEGTGLCQEARHVEIE